MALDVLCTRVNVIRAREKWLKIPRWVELSFGTVSNLQERRHGVPEERVYRTCLLIHLASQTCTDSVYFLSNFRFPCLSFARWRSINILRVVDTDCLTESRSRGQDGGPKVLKSLSLRFLPSLIFESRYELIRIFISSLFRISCFYFKENGNTNYSDIKYFYLNQWKLW